MEIHADNVAVEVGGRRILSDFSVDAASGHMVALTGPSGCGKTTGLNVVSLLVRPAAGSCFVNDVETSGWTDEHRRTFWRDHASFVFQDLGLMLDESVQHNVAIGLGSQRMSAAQKRKRCSEALERVGLADRAGDSASYLSGGERQRAAIARAIAKGASCIFADEPTASLDAGNRDVVYGLLRERTEAGVLVIVATHDRWLADHCSVDVAVGPRPS